ncbi:MAG: HlyD family efflux transporter periplasmic adaptor subunit [Myxococcales bacterium]|nr:HlyD family efflux transporter periplasmic adaptor subunit [Myxococcales bacterium]
MVGGGHFRRGIVAVAPWIFFIATAGGAAYLYFNSAQTAHFLGFAEVENAAVAALEPGRIDSILVDIGQEVRAGQVVVRMTSDIIDSEIAVAQAEIARLEAEIAASTAEAQRVQADEGRRASEYAEELRLELVREEQLLALAQANEKALRQERDRQKKLVAEQLATADSLAEIELDYAAAKNETIERPRTIEVLKAQIRQADERNEVQAALDESALIAPLEREIEMVRRTLDGLQVRRKALELRAPASGRITMLWRRTGEVIAAGEPIVMMVSTRAARVLTCVAETAAMDIRIGDKAELRVRGKDGEPLRGRAVALGPLVEEVPLRCRRVPDQPAWGRNVVVQLDNPVELLPGLAFDVLFHRGDAYDSSTAIARPSSPTEASPTPGSGDIRPMEVPESLRQLSRFEPSGMVWLPRQSRYLIVSDDTGHKSSREHSAWLFTMSMEGQVDPDPVVVQGDIKFNDLESIAAVDEDSIYVLSAQSHSNAGKRSKHRTGFHWLKRSGSGYRVQSTVYFASLLDNLSPEQLSALGLPQGTGNLEIEGMTNVGRSLLLGLKSPLDENGKAMIWRLGNPERLFSDQSLESAELTLWGRVALATAIDDQPAQGGISELLSPSDGLLLVAATPSAQNTGRESGSVWVIENARGGDMTGELVRQFPRLRPEAMSLSPISGQFVIGFDAGESIPSWTTLPLPN